MTKRYIGLAMVLALGLAICGCGANTSDTSDTSENTNALTQEQVRVNETVLTIGDAMDNVKNALGEPEDYTESKSCMYDGYDKTYTYEDVMIITYPLNGGEYIGSITIRNNSVESGCDVKLADTTEAIKAAYGEDNLTITATCYIYEKDDFGIAFYLDGETITEIELYSIAE